MSNRAKYHFLPWVREGYTPSKTEQLQDPIDAAGELDVNVVVKGQGDGSATETASVTLDMYGPGDVVGLDERQVVRMEPEPHTPDFTPNYFPMVEFDRPDLPWLFSPLQADSDGKLRPWFCLVVVEKGDGVTISAETDRPLPVLTIGDGADPAEELPDPTNAWAWVHAQAVGDSAADGEVTRDSKKTRARLVAPRRLEPDTSYHACVVPTFKPGQLAGLGEEPYPDANDNGNGNGDEDSGGRSGPVSMAWNPSDPPETVKLPVYHSWEFKTGERGDFESLVRKLEPETLDSIGYRDLDASQPGVEALETVRRPQDVRLEGALRSAGLDDLEYGDEQRETLQELLNGELTEDEDTRPTFGPPMYGRYHADEEEITVNDDEEDASPSWFRQLNLDPANRVAAGLGVKVVREHQEALMASAWDQVGDIRQANRLLRRAQLSREASNRIHEYLDGMTPEEVLTVSAPMHDRARWSEAGDTFAEVVRESRVPAEALSPALRRLLRRGGPLAARLDGSLPGQKQVIEKFNKSGFTLERPEEPDGTGLVREDAGQEICDALQDMPDLTGRDRRPFEERFDDAERGELINGLWSDCSAVENLVVELDEMVDDEVAQELLVNLQASMESVCRQRGGDFDDESNLLAGLEDAIDEGDEERVVEWLIRIAQSQEAACDRARTLQRLAQAGELSGVDPSDVEDVVGDILAVCRAFREQLAILAARQLPTVCGLAHDVVPTREDVPTDGPVGDRIEVILLVCEAVCGPAGQQPGSAGLVGDLLNRLQPGSVRDPEEILRALRRWIAVARDHLSDPDVRAELGDLARRLSAACRQVSAIVDLVADGVAEPDPNSIRNRLENTVCGPTGTPPIEPPPLDLPAMADAVIDALDPETAIPRRVTERIDTEDDLRSREDPVEIIMEEPDFPRPMYKPLAGLSEEHLLPGVGSVPEDSLGLLESNPEFIESYMVGLNDEMSRELRWREYPTDMRGTYFTQFWGAEGAVPEPTADERADVEDIHTWGTGSDAASLGNNLTGGAAGSDVVLIVRGELLRRYPNTTIYAAKAIAEDSDNDDGGRVPAVSSATTAPDPSSDDLKFPEYRGTIDPDITFLGFDLTAEDAIHGRNSDRSADEQADGWFVVIEEPPGEPRFGLDVDQGDVGEVPDGITTASGGGGGGGSSGTGSESGWSALSWGHMVEDTGDDPLSELTYLNTEEAVPGTEGWASEQDDPEWGENGAHMAAITWQKPVRIAIHADDMLPADAANGGGS